MVTKNTKIEAYGERTEERPWYIKLYSHCDDVMIENVLNILYT